MAEHRMYINGEWRDAADGGTREAINPATGEAFAETAWGGREDARAAIEAAGDAQADWAARPLYERADTMIRCAEILEDRWEELADVLTTDLGKPRHGEATAEARDFVPVFYRQAAEMARYQEGETFWARDPRKRLTTFRRPRGVVAVITPWNFPAMIPSEYIPYALVTGNTVTWTPAPTAVATACKLTELLVEADLPAGVLNMVPGPGPEVGDEFVTSDGTHAVCMTGSTATGRIIAERAGLKPRVLELGGNGPIVVLPDADPRQAAAAVAPACFFAAGQVCSSAERIFVPSDLQDDFAGEMVERTADWVQGDVWDEATTMGPQNSMDVVEQMQAHVKDATDKGAEVLAGGGRPDRPGFWHEPTVLVNFSEDSLVNTRETFGPIAPIRGYADDEEVRRFIAGSDLGLVSAVFTRDVDQAWKWAERLRTGVVVVNDQTNFWEPHVPFGGMTGTGSGTGRLGGRRILEFMTDLQTIAWNVE